MTLLQRPGTYISYNVSGDGNPLLLTHGFAATSNMFSGNLPELTQHNQVITWDIRGHGASDYPEVASQYTISASVGDMVALLDVLGIERATIGGHSIGGYLSLAFAIEHPDRLNALVLIDSGPGFRRPSARDAWNQVAEGYAVNLEAHGLDGMAKGREQQLASHRDATGLVRAARGILKRHDSSVREGLSSISVPTLVIVGGDDTSFLKGAYFMTQEIPDARLAVIAGAGHAPNVSHPEEFNAQLSAFLDNVSSQAGTRQ